MFLCYWQAGYCVEREKGKEARRAGLGDTQQHQVPLQEGQVCLCWGGHQEAQRYTDYVSHNEDLAHVAKNACIYGMYLFKRVKFACVEEDIKKYTGTDYVSQNEYLVHEAKNAAT